MGIPYDTSRATTEALRIALKALLDPRKMQPKIMTRTKSRISAFMGTLRDGCTLEKKRENGRPPSTAKAHVILVDVVRIPIVANSRQIRGMLDAMLVSD